MCNVFVPSGVAVTSRVCRKWLREASKISGLFMTFQQRCGIERRIDSPGLAVVEHGIKTVSDKTLKRLKFRVEKALLLRRNFRLWQFPRCLTQRERRC